MDEAHLTSPRCSARRCTTEPTRVRTAGYSLLELLLVLGLLGLFTAWALSARPSQVAAAVVALRTQVLQARFAAIERNQPVAVLYRDAEESFVTLVADSAAIEDACLGGEELTRLRLQDFRGVGVKSAPAKGLVWLPSGTGRTCSGGGAFNQTIALADSVREGRVVVSRAGRVRSEVGR